MPAGTLYLVATPIGNLEDITYRAVRILGEVTVIACEDTRQSRKLLTHLGIEKKLLSYHEHNEKQRAAELINRLKSGDDIAVISDAGTPIISDPGYHIVNQAVEQGISIVPVPGPSAAVTAVVASGIPSESFLFLGFVSQKGKRRKEALEMIRSLDQTIVLYEAPHRILALLDDLAPVTGNRRIVAAREMTKLHEEFLRGTAAEVRKALSGRQSVKGEFTVVIARPEPRDQQAPDEETILRAVRANMDEGLPKMDAIKTVAKEYHLPKGAVYKLVENAPDA